MFGGVDILARLSTGGMGEVLLGRRRGVLGFEKLVAVKTIRGDFVERADFRAMFLDEARLVARLEHPTITQVYDFGEDGRSLYISMEYVAGVSLGQLLRAGRAPLAPAPAARMIAEVLRGLHFAHDATDAAGDLLGVVHRDVSPQNLIVTFDGRMKILDFGIAITKDRNAPETQVGVLKGKPSYMAPEQLRGGAVDRRADVFSASVVLYEVLTGRKLFTRETALATALAVESDPIDPPSSVVSDVPKSLEAIVMRGLSRKPEDRYPDAQKMAEALERVAGEIAGTTVQDFAAEILVEEAEAHQRWLIDVLDRAESVGDGSAHGPAPEAALLMEALPGPPPELRVQQAPLEVPPEPVHGDETTMLPQIGRGSDARILTGSLLIGVLFLLGTFLWWSGRGEAQPPMHAEPLPEVLGLAGDATVSAALVQLVPPEASRDDEGERPRSPRRRPPKPQPRTESEPPAERPIEALGTALLTIGADPYALVRIDGEDSGVTPIVRKKISAGAHQIELLSPDTGEVRLKQRVELSADEHRRILIP